MIQPSNPRQDLRDGDPKKKYLRYMASFQHLLGQKKFVREEKQTFS